MNATVISAQRLSASEIQHLTNRERRNTNPVECSTPFGIRDSTSYSNKASRLGLQCAQRLSASEIQHLGAAWKALSAKYLSAQRLSASEIQHLSKALRQNN